MKRKPSAKTIVSTAVLLATAFLLFTAEPAVAQSKGLSAYAGNTPFTFEGEGVRTTVRGSKVDVSGSGFFTDFSDNVRITAAVPELQLSDTQSNGQMWRLMSGSSAAGSFNIYDHTAGVYRLTIGTSGNVGIGTTSPATKLDVAGITQTQDMYINSGAYSGSLTWGGTGYAQWYMTGSGASSSVRFKTWDGSSYSDKVTFQNNGNVGIGTTSPSAKLHIAAANDTSPVWAQVNTSAGSGLGYFGVEGSTANSFFSGTLPYATAISSGASGTALQLGSAGSVKMTILSGGNVGIGTTSPADRLAVRGANGNGALEFGNNTFAGGLFANSIMSYDRVASAYKDLRIVTDGSNATLVLQAGGNVGIGNTNPQFKLDVSGTVNATGLNINGSPITSSQWSNGTGNVNYTSGNVGIGTTVPSTNLHVYKSANTTTGIRLENDNSGSSAEARLRVVADSVLVDVLAQSVAGGQLAQLQAQNNQGFIFNQVANSYLALQTNNTERMRIQAGGNVGIGTTTPQGKLHIKAGTNKNIWLRDGGISQNAQIISVADDNGTINTLSIDGSNLLLNSQSTGTVGIGTATPNTAYKLDVNGDVRVSGNINAKYQDVAEWVESSEQLAAGTVVVLDQTKSNQVISSTQSYDTRVAGVISAQPGITLGEKGDSKVLVATTGRVKVKVDATKSPIQIGDLLVTSDVPGVAMKSEAVNLGGVQFHRPGTLIGKAIEPLAKGKGEILVLLSLQ